MIMTESTAVLTSLALTQLATAPLLGSVPVADAWAAKCSVLQEAGMRLYDAPPPHGATAADEIRVHVERCYRLEAAFRASTVHVSESAVGAFTELERHVKLAPLCEVVAFIELLAPVTGAFTAALQAEAGFRGSSLEAQLRVIMRSADLAVETIRALNLQDGG